jgi:SAM-dependent methyltransferase
MERSDYTRIAHDGLAVMNPLEPAQLDALVAALDLPPGARVVDLGCGKGDLLRRILARYDVEAVGVDRDPALLAELPPGATGVVADARQWPNGQTGFDLAVSIGSVVSFHELAGLADYVLFGGGYWRREPSDAYLEALGATRDELPTLEGLHETVAGIGVELLRAETASMEAFDRYEDAWAANGERYAASNPDEPGVDEFRDWIRAGRRRYRELGGRETLGFAVVLARRPSRPVP